MHLVHNGTRFALPFLVNNATSVNLYSLFNYSAACRFCEKENYKPIRIITPDGEEKAAGAVAAIDYKNTSAIPYREWSLIFFVARNDQDIPSIQYINETSLLFQSVLDNERIGNSVFAPKMILDEPLPIEIGSQYYGYPKELGDIKYQYAGTASKFTVTPKKGPWIMKATFPTKSGVVSKINLLWNLFTGYDFRLVMQLIRKKHFIVNLIGSAAILPKRAIMKIQNDPNTIMYPWTAKDCKLQINPESDWGKNIIDLNMQPKLVCHVPELKFEFSEPLDQT